MRMKTDHFRPADCKQREQALDPASSFIVEAPAGSGKTGLLIQRYLRLLSVVERPESVIAMTFTRKAAAEMKDRVIKALERCTSNEEVESDYELRVRELSSVVLSRDRDRGWNLLSDTSRLQIQTIDSLCATLTRQMPVASDFAGIADVIEDAGQLYCLAARNTIRDLAEGGEGDSAIFRRLALHFDNDVARLESQIAGMLAQRDQWSFLRGDEGGLAGDLSALLVRSVNALQQVFCARSAVDFIEVTRAASKALGTSDRPADLLYSLDYRIEHLLVDEFQDTSRAQYNLLERLTAQWSDDGLHTLFLVGDPAQSIYGFREAEIGLFLKCWRQQRLGSVRLHPLRLTSNFRSTPELVDWVQDAFGRIMSKDDEIQGAVQLQRSFASRAPGGNAPRVIALIEDKGQQEAQEIVRIIQAASGKKIAILVRSRTHIQKILPALRRAGIRYRAVEIDRLKDQQHILDLLSLTRALLHVADRVAWLACLHAPWCGLTLADLSILAENERDRTVLDLLSDPDKIATLSLDGRDRAVRIYEILSAAVTSVCRLPLRDLVERTWFALGGPAILCKQNQLEDADTFFGLLDEFDEGGVIRDFSLLNERLEDLFAKSAVGDDCIDVMTIHEAKGLEFDVVILPELGRATKATDKSLLIWTERLDENGEPVIWVAPQPQKDEKDEFYELIREERKAKEHEEAKRLFYVAATRARDELYLLGNARGKRSGRECCRPNKNTFLGFIWDTVQQDFQAALRGRVGVQTNLFTGVDPAPKTILSRLPAGWRTPQLASSVQWQPKLKRETASAQTITYEWASDTRRHVGTVVHELLKRIAREGASAWNPERLTGILPTIQSELLRLGVARSEMPDASAQVVRALKNTIQSERGRWILQSHTEAHSEWPLAGKFGDTLVSGIIDRILRDENGSLWIVDFKTSEHEGGGLQAFLDNEQARYRPQLDTYAALLSRLNQAPIRLGLYFPLHDGWREWAFEKKAAPAHHYTDL